MSASLNNLIDVNFEFDLLLLESFLIRCFIRNETPMSILPVTFPSGHYTHPISNAPRFEKNKGES